MPEYLLFISSARRAQLQENITSSANGLNPAWQELYHSFPNRNTCLYMYVGLTQLGEPVCSWGYEAAVW